MQGRFARFFLVRFQQALAMVPSATIQQSNLNEKQKQIRYYIILNLEEKKRSQN